MFTARYGLITYIKQILFRLQKVNLIRTPDFEYNTDEQNTVYYKNHTQLYWKYKNIVGKLRGVSVIILKEIFALYETWNLIKLPCSQKPATVHFEQKQFITHTSTLYL